MFSELMARPSTRMVTHGASSSLRVLLAMYGTLHRADTPKVKSRGVKPGELGVYLILPLCPIYRPGKI